MILSNYGPILRWNNKIYLKLSLKNFLIFPFNKISLKLKYIELETLDYIIVGNDLNKHSDKNWALRIICPEALDYWKSWEIELGSWFFPRKELNWQFLSVKFINNGDKSKIFYDKKDLILVLNCLEIIHYNLSSSRAKFYINNREMDIDKDVEFFEALSKTNKIELYAEGYHGFFVDVKFNGKTIFKELK